MFLYYYKKIYIYIRNVSKEEFGSVDNLTVHEQMKMQI